MGGGKCGGKQWRVEGLGMSEGMNSCAPGTEGMVKDMEGYVELEGGVETGRMQGRSER